MKGKKLMELYITELKIKVAAVNENHGAFLLHGERSLAENKKPCKQLSFLQAILVLCLYQTTCVLSTQSGMWRLGG
jgi:hypothetical protein